MRDILFKLLFDFDQVFWLGLAFVINMLIYAAGAVLTYAIWLILVSAIEGMTALYVGGAS